MEPILILLIGMAAILGGILVLRLNAFLALISAAILVSLLSPGLATEKITRVAEAFGRTSGNVGIVIALAAVIGTAMMQSGAADRIVQWFLDMLGEKRGATAMAASGYILSIPVFFDTVFYLLVPLARSMYRRTNRHYLKYLLAIPAGGVVTHTMVPPTPGPLATAATLGVDIGMMILVGVAVSFPAAAVGLAFAGWMDRRMTVAVPTEVEVEVPAEAAVGGGTASEAFRSESDPAQGGGGYSYESGPGQSALRASSSDPSLPGLLPSLMPILLPVILISSNTIASTLADGPNGEAWAGIAGIASIVGNANFALLVSTAFALWVYARHRGPTREQMTALVETSLMSGGLIILITAGGGAFGAMLQAAGIGPRIEGMLTGGSGSGYVYLFVGFAVASVLKFAQGSTTVAMITTAAMMLPMLEATSLPFHPVYVATAIGGGAMVGSWMNDSGFWVFTKMGGLTETQSLRAFTPLLAIVGASAMVVTVILATVLPLT